MGAVANITKADRWFKGEDKIIRYTVVDSAGAAVDVAGYTAEWVLRLGPDGPTAIITKTTGGSGITLPAPTTDGIIEVAIDDIDTDNLTASDNYHKTLKRTNSGNEGVLADGFAVLQEPSTRP